MSGKYLRDNVIRSPKWVTGCELSVLVGCIRHLTCEAEMESDLIAGSSARILSAMTKALIDDMELGMNRQTE